MHFSYLMKFLFTQPGLNRFWAVVLLAGPAALAEQVSDTRFSIDRGFYASATNLVISSDTAAASITYTLDGSDPRTSGSAVTGANPATVLIDPASADGKWKAAPAVMVRAYAHQTGLEDTNVDTHTYIFPDAVITQGDIRPDGSYVFWNSTEMDPEVVTDPAYSDELETALLSLPALSIVMAHEDLFGTEGIHRGDNLESDWEMPCSMELIYPDNGNFHGFEGFQIDCGIKNQGGGGLWDEGTYDHKQSFGIRFRRQYGSGKLDYPFFEHAPLNSDSAAETYDKLILRAGHNKSYGIDWDIEHTVYARDQLARDLQIDLSGIGGHGSFVHLYLNGIYWGLYNPCERQDHAFLSTYLGGNEEDYYCGKARGGDVSGPSTRYAYWADTVSQSSSLSNLLEYCNIDAHADMSLINSYAATGDFPQYYFGVGNNPGGQVYLLNWDAEDAFGGGSRRSSNTPSTGIFDEVEGFDNMWANNAEYRINFADRAYKACFNGGALTDDHVLERWNMLCDTIYSAMICESARWGDERLTTPATRDDDWTPARELVTEGTAGKAERLIGVLIDSGLYPSLNPPLFENEGSPVEVSRLEVSAGYSLSLERDGSAGTIYYTTDGSDPRAVGGSAQGIDAGTGTTITINSTTQLKARTLDGDTWSALHETLFFVDQDFSGLKITEIMYNPADRSMAAGAAIESIIGDAVSVDSNYVGRALVEFAAALPESLTGGDKLTISGALTPENNGTFTVSKVIYDGTLSAERSQKVLLTETLVSESSSGMTADLLYDGDRYEFVEIKNSGESTLNLSGVTFTKGIQYEFPDGTLLEPDRHAVVARQVWDFAERYPAVTPVGGFPASSLDNGGELVELAMNNGIRHEIVGTVTTDEGEGAVILPAVPDSIGVGDRVRISLSTHVGNNGLFKIKSKSGNIIFVDEPLPTEPLGAKAFFFDVITAVEYDDDTPWPLPPDGYGFSLVPTNSNPTADQDSAEAWRTSANEHGSPGTDDPEPEPASIKINEVLTHTDEPQRDTVELYNPGEQAEDLGGWYLTDDPDEPTKWTIPEGTVIPANGYQVFYEGHYVSSVLEFDDDEFGSAFSLSSTGDEIYLFSPTLGYSHGFSFEGAYNGISFGRYETSGGEELFPSQKSFTPSEANSGPAVGPVVITEIMYNPADDQHEYIELLNISESAVSLYDSAAPTNTWTVGGISFEFPESNISINPGQLLMLVRDTISTADFRSLHSISNSVLLYNYTGKLDNGGETITLRAPDEPVRTGSNAGEVPYIVVDRISYDDEAPWPEEADGTGRSLERISIDAYGNDASNWSASSVSGGSPGSVDFSSTPLIVDNDGDGLDDSWETTYFNSTNHPSGGPDDDYDQDGQSNLDEYISGTVPTNAVSRFEAAISTVDITGLTHFTISWNAASNRVYDVLWAPRLGEGFQYLTTGITYPQNSYTDTVHTVSDSCYYRILTRMPLPGDLDADGLPDAWENLYFSDTYAAEAHLDSDGDRISNAGEYIAGTDPTDSTSYLGLTSVKPSANGCIVEWTAVTGRVYRIHYTEAIDQPRLPISAWMPYPANAYTDTVHTTQDSGYYDIRAELEQ